MELYSKILNIYLLFNILKKIWGAHSPPLLVHDTVPVYKKSKRLRPHICSSSGLVCKWCNSITHWW